MTYAELVVAVQDYLENTFDTTLLSTCIQQAETRIYNSVQLAALRKNATLTATIGSPYINCPTDFLAAFSIAAVAPGTGAYTFLLEKDVSFIREAYPTPTVTGTPRYYAVFGPQAAAAAESRFIVAPSPDAAYSMDIDYFFYPESIVTANTTWLGDNYSPALLYGTLVEAYTVMKGEEDMLKLYVAKFSEALSQLKQLGEGMGRQDAYRNGQPRVAVK